MAADETWTLADWQALLNPLFTNASTKTAAAAHLMKFKRRGA